MEPVHVRYGHVRFSDDEVAAADCQEISMRRELIDTHSVMRIDVIGPKKIV